MEKVNAPLVIVGEGELEQRVKDQVAKAGLESRVHFTGRLDDESLLDMYHACELFVLPSTSPAEAFGLVQIEAMLAGKPIINTAVKTGVPFVSLDQESGLTVPPGDAGSLCDAINRLMVDDSLRKRLGHQARLRALSLFTSDRYVNDIYSIYNKLSPDAIRTDNDLEPSVAGIRAAARI
ncbi:MAG: glycosyltransferase, partial [Cyanobacteria bacterium]|nr:glycosyltransferase [Cyanobacteriota bacterium]